MTLFWPNPVLEELKPWAERCYPYEGCGLLLGTVEGRDHRVSRFAPLPNVLREKQKVGTEVLAVARETLGSRADTAGEKEFVLDPAAFNRVSLEAARQGLDVVGILHTHPDHPAKPSPTDAAQPMLSGYSVVIVKVDQGRFIEARSWRRDEESLPFAEESIVFE